MVDIIASEPKYLMSYEVLQFISALLVFAFVYRFGHFSGNLLDEQRKHAESLSSGAQLSSVTLSIQDEAEGDCEDSQKGAHPESESRQSLEEMAARDDMSLLLLQMLTTADYNRNSLISHLSHNSFAPPI